MKRLFLMVGLLLSFSAWSDVIQDWNKKFSELNSVPLNLKWTPSGQQNYYKDIMSRNPSYFKNPDHYPSIFPTPTPPILTPPTPTPPILTPPTPTPPILTPPTPTPPILTPPDPVPIPEAPIWKRDLIIKGLLDRIRVDMMTIESYLQVPIQ